MNEEISELTKLKNELAINMAIEEKLWRLLIGDMPEKLRKLTSTKDLERERLKFYGKTQKLRKTIIKQFPKKALTYELFLACQGNSVFEKLYKELCDEDFENEMRKELGDDFRLNLDDHNCINILCSSSLVDLIEPYFGYLPNTLFSREKLKKPADIIPELETWSEASMWCDAWGLNVNVTLPTDLIDQFEKEAMEALKKEREKLERKITEVVDNVKKLKPKTDVEKAKK